MPKLAALFRQLSLFDKVEEPVITKPPVFYPTVLTGFENLCNGPFAHIEVKTKPRLWNSWKVVWTRRNESLKLEVPAHLAEAPEGIKQALLQWALLVSKRRVKPTPEIKLEKNRLENLIRAYLQEPGHDPASKVYARLKRRNLRRQLKLKPQGHFHNLEDSFKRVNARYFNGLLSVSVTWSARLGGLSTHTLAQDGQGQTYHLITISLGYDNAEVTPEILDGVMYHECLHAAIPPETRNGRRIVHGPEFRKRERAYEHYLIWRNWHRDGLPKSLQQLKRRLKRSRLMGPKH